MGFCGHCPGAVDKKVQSSSLRRIGWNLENHRLGYAGSKQRACQVKSTIGHFAPQRCEYCSYTLSELLAFVLVSVGEIAPPLASWRPMAEAGDGTEYLLHRPFLHVKSIFFTRSQGPGQQER